MNTHGGMRRVSDRLLEAVDTVSTPAVVVCLSSVATSVVESADPPLSSLVRSI